MPTIIIGRVRASNFEILLQKRGFGDREWCMPGGAYQTGTASEDALRKHPSCPRDTKDLVARRAAVREIIEEVGGGSCGTSKGVSVTLPEIRAPFPGGATVPAESYAKIELPPGLLRMIDDPSCCRLMSMSRSRDVFVYLVHPQVEVCYTTIWKPRGTLHWRGEMDETWNAKGTGRPGRFGYVWRPLELVGGSLDRPVPYSDKGMIAWLWPFFAGNELRNHLFDLASASGALGVAAAAEQPGGSGGGAAKSPRSPRSTPRVGGGATQAVPMDVEPPAPPAPHLGPPLKMATGAGATAAGAKASAPGMLGVAAGLPSAAAVGKWASSGGSRRCRVAGCTACRPTSPHYCRLCGDIDSTHRSYDCPESKVIYFIRHGESTANVCGAIDRHNHPDPLLTPKGLGQACRLNAMTRAWGVQAVVSSPLRRAIYTAHLAFQGQDVPHVLQPKLREISGLHATHPADHSSHHADNRGRPGSSLQAFIAECLSTQSGPHFDLPNVQALDDRQDELWQPEVEEKQPKALIDQPVLAGAIDYLLQRAERTIGVVTHWTLLNRLFGVNARNCCAYRITIHPVTKCHVVMMQDLWPDWQGGWVRWDEAEERRVQAK